MITHTNTFCGKLLFTCLLFWAQHSSILLANSFKPHTINYNVTDGLPSSETYDVFQDSKGFLWIGTDKGVARFDGENFLTYTTNDGLADNTIFRFYEDHLNRIWFLSYERKLSYLENDSIYSYKYNDKLVSHFSNIYIGNVITHFEISRNNQITILLSNFRGVQIDSLGSLTPYNPDYIPQLQNSFYNSLTAQELREKATPLLVGHFPGKKITAKLSRKSFATFYQYHGNWVELGPNGVLFYNNITFEVNKRFLEPYFITGMAEDFEGGLWFSTLNHGVMYIPKPSLEYYPISENISNLKLQGILFQDSILTFNYSNNVIYGYYENQPRLTSKKWNYFKASRTDKNSPRFENSIIVSPFTKPIKSITHLNDSSWLYASNALSYIYATFNSNNSEFKERGFIGPKINKILRTNNDSIWLGCTNGIFLLGKDSLPYRPFKDSNILNNISIQDISVLPDGTLIFASRVNGLYHLINDSIYSFNVSDGLISNTINQIFHDSLRSLLWVATPRGISSLQLKDHYLKRTVHAINTTSGLKSTDVRQFHVDESYLFFGTESGINRILISELEKATPPPFCYLNNIRVKDSTFSNFENLVLNYSENTISMNFIGVSFSSFNKLKYHYFITGLDDNWRSTYENSVTFYNLPPGHYIFNLIAENTSGSFSIRKSFPFVIRPAFWMTAWFKALIFFLIALLLYFAIKLFISRFKTKAQLQIDIQHLKSMNLQSKMNPHFIFNSLNSIQHYILANNPTSANSYLIEFSRLIRKVLTNSFASRISLAEDLETIKLYVSLEQKRLDHAFYFEMDIHPDIDIENCQIPSLLLQPFIENAIWHGNLKHLENGQLVLRIQLKNGRLFFEIEDNGMGYFATIKAKKESKHLSVGTVVTQERLTVLSRIDKNLSSIEILNASNLICNMPNKGTLIKFNTSYNLK